MPLYWTMENFKFWLLLETISVLSSVVERFLLGDRNNGLTNFRHLLNYKRTTPKSLKTNFTSWENSPHLKLAYTTCSFFLLPNEKGWTTAVVLMGTPRNKREDRQLFFLPFLEIWELGIEMCSNNVIILTRVLSGYSKWGGCVWNIFRVFCGFMIQSLPNTTISEIWEVHET